jgi:hypothetical protein
MSSLNVQVPETEALALYRLLHRLPDGQEMYWELYRQLQLHFFQTLTVEEVTQLLEGEP